MGGRKVLLFGNSMLLALVTVGLVQRPELNVEQAATWEEVSLKMAEDSALDTLIFDLTGIGENHLLELLFKKPGLLLIGLDPERDDMLVLSGQLQQALETADIVNAIRLSKPSEKKKTGECDEKEY